MSREKEIKLIIDALSHEKELPKDIVFEALEEALIAAYQKHVNDYQAQLEVEIDRKTGKIHAARLWDVVENDMVHEPSLELPLDKAQLFDVESYVGKKIREHIDSADLGRIGAQLAKQAVYNRLKLAKKELLAQGYHEKIGQLVSGTVKKATRELVILDLPNGAEGLLPRREMIPREAFRTNDRVRAVIKDVVFEKKGPSIILSRGAPEMLSELFTIEVPEIAEGSIEIRAIARDPGSRAKIAVQAKDARIEPKGACIGMRGSRVNSVIEELGGERIDVILWDENDAQFVVNALAPAEVQSIVVDETNHSMQVVVDESALAQAIGKSGQNVKLASDLTGWKISILSKKDADEKQQADADRTFILFKDEIGFDEELALLLVEAGFSDAQEVAYIDSQEYYAMGLDDEIISYLRENAQSYLLQQSSKKSDLMALPSMTADLKDRLIEQEIVNLEQLADLATDDLIDLVADCSVEQAQAVIIEARERLSDLSLS